MFSRELFFVAAFVSSVCFINSQPPWNWFAIAAALAAADLIQQQRKLQTSSRRPEFARLFKFFLPVLPPLLIFSTASFLLYPALLGDRPISWDHVVHYGRAWNFGERLFSARSLFGWSHNWFAGYPIAYTYPIGSDLVVSAVYSLFLGTISFSSAYGVAVLLTYNLLGWSVYRLGRDVFGKIPSLIAALFFLVDEGGMTETGWGWTIYWGVWPSGLSMAFSLLAVAQLEAVLFGKGRRPLGIFGFFFGLAVLSHPQQLMHFAVVLPIAMLLFSTSCNLQQFISALIRLIIAAAIGILISCLWLLPYISVADYVETFGLGWIELPEAGRRIFSATIFEGVWVVINVSGFLGSLLLLRSKKFTPLLYGLLPFVFLLIACNDFARVFQLHQISEFFARLQFERFVGMAKPYLFLAAGWLFCCGYQKIGAVEKNADRAGLALGQTAKVFIIAFFLLPLLIAFSEPLRHMFVGREVEWNSRRGDQQDRDELVRWLLETTGNDRRFYRVALAGEELNRSNDYLDLTVPLGRPVYKGSYTPALFFANQPDSFSEETLNLLDVRFVVSKQELSEKGMLFKQRFGSLFVYEYSSWTGIPYQADDVQLLQFSSEKISFEAGARAEGELLLHVSYFPRWRAYYAGEEIPITINRSFKDHKLALMSINLNRGPGIYTFEFRRNWIDSAALIFFSVGIAVLGFCMLERRIRKEDIYST